MMRCFTKTVLLGSLSLYPCLSSADDLNVLSNMNQFKKIDSSNWFERIELSGLLMGELILSNYNQGDASRFGDKRNYSTFCFPRGNLNVDAELDSWLRSHFTFNFRSSCGFGGKNDEWSFANYGTTSEGYVDIGEKDSVIQGRVGIQYLPYGNYARNKIPATMTQLLTQSQVAGATMFAKLTPSIDTAVFVFSGNKKRNSTTKIANAGFQVGGEIQAPELSTRVDFGYMYNMAAGINFLHVDSNTGNPLRSGFRKKVPGATISLVTKACDEWSLKLIYAGALSKFDSQDIAWKGDGAKPKAYLFALGKDMGLTLGNNNYKSNLTFSYQRSSEAVNLRGGGLGRGLPKNRWQLDYDVELNKYFDTGVHFIRDKDYSTGSGGTGRSSFTTLVSMVVKIA